MTVSIVGGILAVALITCFVLLARRSTRWSYPAGGQGPGYVPDGSGHAPSSAGGMGAGMGVGGGGGGGDCGGGGGGC